MKTATFALVFPLLLGLTFVHTHTASANPRVSVCSVGMRCFTPLDYIDSTLLLRRVGTLEQRRFRLRRNAFNGSFSVTVTGLTAGTYTARVGNTHGFFHHMRSNGRIGKFKFYREDVDLTPTTFTSTGPTQKITVTAAVSNNRRCEAIGQPRGCLDAPG